MTVPSEIPPEMEAVLAAKAELFGLALPDYLFSLLETNVDDEYSMTVEEIASVQERCVDFSVPLILKEKKHDCDFGASVRFRA